MLLNFQQNFNFTIFTFPLLEFFISIFRSIFYEWKLKKLTKTQKFHERRGFAFSPFDVLLLIVTNFRCSRKTQCFGCGKLSHDSTTCYTNVECCQESFPHEKHCVNFSFLRDNTWFGCWMMLTRISETTNSCIPTIFSLSADCLLCMAWLPHSMSNLTTEFWVTPFNFILVTQVFFMLKSVSFAQTMSSKFNFHSYESHGSYNFTSRSNPLRLRSF